MREGKVGRSRREPDVIGWREIVALPELGVTGMRAKIDTGARTSAIHADQQEVFERETRRWVRFRVPGSRYHRDMRIEAPIFDERLIKNTSGIPEQRLVIETLLVLGRHRWHVEVSLANRENMGLDMILGRTAIRNRRVLVNPGKSFLAGKPVELKQPSDRLRSAVLVPVE
ncbi:RimK/LysX family protein [Roseibium polysiphoniae]|uniref:ATP-dependent zinc protease n=1 Tax=Roseibium polysiphoniae TaxID=2571221 RepID=A0ABR9CA25_9HYPH|nr:RimK/LysX family protein [Roseibium polysiphoniae]MBD8876394.1 ATP-dependent zinc protease [Roseibium polysiphoniae]